MRSGYLPTREILTTVGVETGGEWRWATAGIWRLRFICLLGCLLGLGNDLSILRGL